MKRIKWFWVPAVLGVTVRMFSGMIYAEELLSDGSSAYCVLKEDHLSEEENGFAEGSVSAGDDVIAEGSVSEEDSFLIGDDFVSTDENSAEQDELLSETPLNTMSSGTGNAAGTCTWTLENGVLTISGTGTVEASLWDAQLVEKVVIGEGITGIGLNAFTGHRKLVEVSFPESLESIDAYAFRDCAGLREIHLPAFLNSLGAFAFASCTSLQSAVIDCDIDTIEVGVFKDCTALSDISISSNVLYIKPLAFENCNSLSAVSYRGNASGWGDILIEEGNDPLVIAEVSCSEDTWNSQEAVQIDCIANKCKGIFLHWKTVKDADGYFVYRKDPGSTQWKMIASTEGGETEMYIDETVSVKPGIYSYTVTSYRDGVEGVMDETGRTITRQETTTTSTPRYRLYNPYSGEHFYTASITEKDMLLSIGWKEEGIAWNSPQVAMKAVYRLYNSRKGFEEHHYTADGNEVAVLVSQGWTMEGIAWYSDDNEGIPVYRLFDPAARYSAASHHYTTDINERDILVEEGWRYEGIAWYGAL